ncbi:hypothetical protein B0T10DRAFT_162323 [Thelonectria olida]|uniref:N-acetyltransferase ESCO zinc-finger domain-containing protein n=1 Tax=Thelonectria olida TaxID=1576542 RepID=A0A9P9AV12_9HYPO|nr:hypothetical protein B0T10DRAFT_162323 [Thelonectria olida]
MAHTGTNTQPRTRTKILRTYGKRPATPDLENDGPSKKQRTSDNDSISRRESRSPEKKDRPSTPKASAATTNTPPKQGLDIKKGSIMNFFRPIPQPSPVLSSPQIDKVEPGSTPPSSPPPASRAKTKRKPRLLKFRGNSLPRLDTNSDSEKSDQEPEKEEDRGKEANEPSRDGTLTNKAAPGLNLGRAKSRASPTVQTTLNISLQAAFDECKICNTVWNPLYPDDVKFHQKQHAAALRRKKKLEESEL